MDTQPAQPLLFTPMRLRGVTLPNRLVLPPMAQYSAEEGVANEFHLAHYGRFAVGGAGLIFIEATGVPRQGRIPTRCLGPWHAPHQLALEPPPPTLPAQRAGPALPPRPCTRQSPSSQPQFGVRPP